MKNNKKNLLYFGMPAIAALAGLIVYLITSYTGYLAATAVNPLPVIATLLAVALLAVLVFAGQRLPAPAADLCMIASTVLLTAGFAIFALIRVSLAADVYFIPVNYPASEATALHISIVGVVLYLAAILAMIVTAFRYKPGGQA